MNVNEIVAYIPSQALKRYLFSHPVRLTILQCATIVSEFAEQERKIEIFKRLSEEASNENEKALLSTAISEICRFGYVSNATNKIYLSRFYEDSSPLFPFLEVCDFPILFQKGDIICNSSKFFYVAAVPEREFVQDFTDESYLCYSLNAAVNSKDDLFAAHEHIHVCVADEASLDNLNYAQRLALKRIVELS